MFLPCELNICSVESPAEGFDDSDRESLSLPSFPVFILSESSVLFISLSSVLYVPLTVVLILAFLSDSPLELH
jgi:hypothetical protein